MHLIEILFPSAVSGAAAELQRLMAELSDGYGGVTAFSRSPAEGLWVSDTDRLERDDIVVVEVMVEELDPATWAALRERLAARLGQQDIVIRATRIERL